MTQQIPHNRPLILKEDRDAADRVLQSGWVGHGHEGKALEDDFTQRLGSGRGCAVSSGSAALALALDVLEIGKGHRVAIPTYACTALLNAVHGAQATPVPVDITPESLNISVATLERAARGKAFDAVIAVHTYGETLDVASLRGAAHAVIEDCCQAIGASFGGRPVGCAADLSVFSFYATKPITCGHGGLLFDPSGERISRAFDYRDFDMPTTYRPRSNVQLSDIQAAIARSQFRRLDAITARRREIAARYLEATPVQLRLWPRQIDGATMPYRFVLKAADERHLDVLRDRFVAAGITTINPFEPREQLHRYMKVNAGDFPESEALCRRTVSVPLYPGLSGAEVERIAAVLAELPPS